jgi:hypothetical protein
MIEKSTNNIDMNSVHISNNDVPLAADQQYMLRSEREGLLKVSIVIIRVIIFLLHYNTIIARCS